jgi:membrane-bound lytic murein transglycosylase A
MNLLYKSICVALLLVLSACSVSNTLPQKLTLKPVSYAQLPGWGADQALDAYRSYQKSCMALLAQDPDKPMGENDLANSVAAYQQPCQIAINSVIEDDTTARVFFQTQFIPFKAANNFDSQGKFTGYFEPVMRGSRTKSMRYNVPVYRTPSDRIPGEPHFTRAEINRGALSGRGLELFWVEDPVRLFFTEVQGSGRIELDTGETVRIGYAERNGHPYVPIGRVLKERGILPEDQISMQAIQDWLWKNPDQAFEVMEQNPSFIFFREIEGDGPIGSQNVALTPMRSLAVDRKFIPLGIPVFVDAMLPQTPQTQGGFFRKLLIAQDTGGAIKGPVRGDIFFGAGNDAEWYAGHMNSGGEYYLLLPRAVAARLL